jgi:hypothetical protein
MVRCKREKISLDQALCNCPTSNKVVKITCFEQIFEFKFNILMTILSKELKESKSLLD